MMQGWKCEICGNTVFGYYFDKEGLNLNCFLARDALPNPLPSLFTIGKLPDVELCIVPGRWKELVGKKGTKGIGTSLIGVVDAEGYVNPDTLDLPLRNET